MINVTQDYSSRKYQRHAMRRVTRGAEYQTVTANATEKYLNNVLRVLERLSTCVTKVDRDSSVKRITHGAVTRNPLDVQI